ncbi:MAG: hypothetical protein L0K86_13375, partial [Actinomycetia bacterium]|nr:hypothetical protein [Actinomycetes bacterium]
MRPRRELAHPARADSDALRVGLVQSAPQAQRLDANARDLWGLIGQLDDVDLVVTPELGLQGYAVPSTGVPTPVAVEAVAQSHARNGAVVGVGFAEARDAAMPFNSYALIGDGATEVQRKLHPVATSPFDEHVVYAGGDALRASSIHGVPVATVVCNDMWHPVVPWLAVQQGAEVLVVPVASAESAAPGVQEVWDAILRHTAQVLQCYVVFVNRCGPDGPFDFWGGSRVIGPEGEVLGRLG